MKALICQSYGPPENLVIGQLPDPKPQDSQVVLEVDAASVNFPDVLMIQNKYQISVQPPFSPGAEVSGTIIEIGKAVSNLKVGDKVIGSCGSGGMAEKTLVEATRCTPVPEGMDMISAAAFLMTYGTSLHALKDRAKVQKGEKLLVLGAAGGVGLAAVELGKCLGAEVIAATSSEEKNKLCKQVGADQTFVYPTGSLERAQQKQISDKIKTLTDGQGADVIYDPIGGDYAEPALRSTNWKGRYLVIGFAAGTIPKIPLNLPLLKGCEIVGVFWGAFSMREPMHAKENLDLLAQWFKEGKVKPHVSKTYALKDGAQALIDMANRKVKGKIVVLPKD